MKLVADRTVISPKGAALTVTLLKLSRDGARLLTVRKTPVGTAAATKKHEDLGPAKVAAIR